MLMATTFADNSTKEIKTDLRNAVQHLNWIKFISSTSPTGEATLSWVNNKLRIQTNNLVFSQRENVNSITWSNLSNILWWRNNTINSWNGDTIIAWKQNSIDTSLNSNILWWIWNKIKSGSKSSTIIWWSNNSIHEWSENSVIAWWTWNNISGNNSAIVWNNSYITGNNSVVIWSWWSINADNSFLWTDWSSNKNISNDNVFAVVSKSWMVINTDNAHPAAQLTIGWSLSIYNNTNDENIQCWNLVGSWIIKTVKKRGSSNIECFCSCNWDSRNSVFWEWECESYCRPDLTPKCGNTITVETVWWKKKPKWTCGSGTVIEWSGSYYMIWNTIYRVCQTANGASVTCSGDVK